MARWAALACLPEDSLSRFPSPPLLACCKSAPTPISAGRGWRGLLRARWRARRRVGRAPVAVAHLWKRRPPPSTISEKLPTQASLTQPAPDWTAESRNRERARQSHANRSPSGPAASKQRPLPYRNRWSSVPAQQSPSLERAYRRRSRNAHFFRCSVRDARGSAAAQNWATLPTLCKCTACQIWWLGMACGLRWVASYKN